MSGNGHIIVVEQQGEVELAGHGITSSFGIIPLLLRSITAEHKDSFSGMSLGHSVDVAPHVAQATGTEKNALRLVPFGMAV